MKVQSIKNDMNLIVLYFMRFTRVGYTIISNPTPMYSKSHNLSLFLNIYKNRQLYSVNILTY